MSFRDGNWNSRFGALGDQAEAVFEAVYEQKWTRYGLNRPEVSLAGVPAFIRYTPDYLTNRGLVEVQGFGRDQVAKFKLDKILALCDWHESFRVDFFIYDSYHKRFGWVRFMDAFQACSTSGGGELRHFPEGNPYWAVAAEDLPVIAWVNLGDALSSDR